MNNSFGTFLKQKRQEKNLTQKQLAELLYVSVSSISKWEKDVAHPDITLLPKLSEILDVTEHELIMASVDVKTREEKKQAKRWRAFSLFWELFFYIAYAVTVVTCFICNIAIEKTLSWFWIVVSALLLSFTFTNLPKIIKKHKLIILPLSMFGVLCLLLGVCAIYTGGRWFLIASVSVLLGLSMIFTPIYISKYAIFTRIRKYNDFVSVGVACVLLNILLMLIDLYTYSNFNMSYWYLNIALPIVLIVYALINLYMSVRFLKVNKLIKTSIVLILIDLLYLIPPFVKVKNQFVQKEINEANIFKADFTSWFANATLSNNIHCIICITILALSMVFLGIGLYRHLKTKA